jgi:hypothetical protein
MKRIYVDHYDATGFIAPTSNALFNNAEAQYKIPSKYIMGAYLEYLGETISDIYLTPTSSFVTFEADISIVESGYYTLKVTATSGSYQLYVNEDLVLSSFEGNGEITILMYNGIASIRFKYLGTTGYNITWKAPTNSVFVNIPDTQLPVYGRTIFPFTIYDSVDVQLRNEYNIIGELYQNRVLNKLKKPGRTFKVTLKQDNVYDRLTVKYWFVSTRGKYKSFLFPSNASDFILKSLPEAGDLYITILKNFSTIAHEYTQRLIYIPELQFITPVYSVEPILEGGIEYEKLVIPDAIPSDVGSCNIQLMFLCRLDTDTLSFELEDINFSSCDFTIKELSNDNQLLRIFT